MGYRSDVRIITTKKGYEELKKYADEYKKKFDKNNDNLLDECILFNETKSLKYFGWDNIKWYEDDYVEVDAIMKGLNHLRDNDYSYRYSRFGEEYDDFEECENNSYKKEKIGLPYICLKREYDDEFVANGMRINEQIIKEVER